MPELEMKMNLQLFRQYSGQRSFLSQQHLFLPIICCCTIIYRNKPIVLEQIFYLNTLKVLKVFDKTPGVIND